MRKGSGKGVRVHAEGYVQIIHRGPWRGWLEHRKVMLEMCREMCYYPIEDGKLPAGFTVDHLDHRRQHNCPENLMLLDKRIHDALSLAHAQTVKELRESVIAMPDWVNNDF
jgi:hypothetical protein